MAEISEVLTYAHENKKFILFRLVAPFIVVSLFLCAFVYGLEWQLRAEQACSAGPCHGVQTAQHP
jgi:hypothetical protein